METYPTDNPEFNELCAQAAERYGAQAEFAYPTQDKKYAMLTLEQALQICGTYMVNTSQDQLWQTLDRFYQTAEKLKQKSEELANLARQIGQAALEKHQ